MQTQQPNRLLPRLGVDTSNTMGHSPSDDAPWYIPSREFTSAHGIALAGLARLGRSLLSDYPKTWPGKLKKLRTLNWRRSNTGTWEGRAMIAGRLSKASTCVVLTGNVLKQTLGVPLSDHENQVEAAWRNRK